MTDASEVVDLPRATLPDIPFNDASLEGRELEYIQESVRSGHASSGGAFTQRTAALLAEETGAEEVLLTTSCTAGPRAVRDAARPRAGRHRDRAVLHLHDHRARVRPPGRGTRLLRHRAAHAGSRPRAPRHPPRRERAGRRRRALRRHRLRHRRHPGGARGLARRRTHRGQRPRSLRHAGRTSPWAASAGSPRRASTRRRTSSAARAAPCC